MWVCVCVHVSVSQNYDLYLIGLFGMIFIWYPECLNTSVMTQYLILLTGKKHFAGNETTGTVCVCVMCVVRYPHPPSLHAALLCPDEMLCDR